MEPQQKQQPACRPDRENCPFYRLSFSQPGRDQDRDSLDTSTLDGDSCVDRLVLTCWPTFQVFTMTIVKSNI